MTTSPRTSVRKRERFLPHAFARHGLDLRVDGISFDDGRPAVCVEEELDARELHLEDDRWSRLEVRGVVTVAPGTLEAVLPPHERERPPTRLVIVMECDATRIRRSVEVALGVAEGAHAFRLIVSRDELDGRLGLSPWWVRATADSPGPAVPGFACEPGMRLAGGAGLGIHMHAPRVRRGEYLAIEYRSFGEDPVLKREPSRLHYLDVDGDTPRLLINADHASVTEILDAKGQTGPKARLREVFFDVVSQSVWQQLFFHSVASMDEEGESRKSWQRGVLAEVLPLALPHCRTSAQRVQEILAIRRDPSALSLLAALCDRALQNKLELAAHMKRVVDETIGTNG